MTLARTLLKTAAIGAALMTSTSAFAQWQGTWDTKYGDVKLHQTGQHVYGDYGTWGTIEGLVSQDRRTIRGVYRRNDDGSSGYFEWRLVSTQGFSGHWASAQRALPRWNGGGTKWTGTRTRRAKPSLSVYRGNGNIGDFFGRQEVKYINWASADWARAVSSASAPPRTASAEQSTAAPAPKKAVNPLAKRFPKMADYPASFKPEFFEVSLNSITASKGRTDAYGVMGIYAYCETSNASKALRAFGNLKPRVFDQPRSDPAVARGERPADLGDFASRKFRLDPACMNDPRGRIKIQIQTNLNDRDDLQRDEKFGYLSYHFYLDQIPSSKASKRIVRIGPRRAITLYAGPSLRADFSFHMYLVHVFDDDGLLVEGDVRFVK